MLLCILHKLVIGFAVVGVINGVFIQAPTPEADGLDLRFWSSFWQPKLLEFPQETFKVASSDNQIMMRRMLGNGGTLGFAGRLGCNFQRSLVLNFTI